MTRENQDRDTAQDVKRKRRYTKRRQQVHRQMLAMGIAFLLILVMIVTNSVRGRMAKGVQAPQASSKITEDRIGKTVETKKERLDRVRKEAETAGYPEGVVELLAKNPDTIDFVEHYKEKKDVKPAGSILEGAEGDNALEYSGKIPKLLQWDERWGYAPYGTSIVAVSGCGPTCMSMVVSGLTGDKTLTPAALAKFGTEQNYVDEDNNTYWTFMREVSANWGVSCREGNTDESQVAAELKAGHPIICSVGPGDFTKSGHFIVLTSYEDGNVTVCDPFSVENSDKTWVYSKIKNQIKALWIYSI